MPYHPAAAHSWRACGSIGWRGVSVCWRVGIVGHGGCVGLAHIGAVTANAIGLLPFDCLLPLVEWVEAQPRWAVLLATVTIAMRPGTAV